MSNEIEVTADNEECKFIVERFYYKIDEPEILECLVSLRIETETPLPDKFFSELCDLVNKYQK